MVKVRMAIANVTRNIGTLHTRMNLRNLGKSGNFKIHLSICDGGNSKTV
jgi:hypothetical protein